MKNVGLTIVMLSFNQAAYLRKAVESILHQTFSNFELIIIDDGSTDQSRSLLNRMNDDRIRLVLNEGNRGIVYCRNLGLELAKTEFVAFFDADDVAHPDKFRRQICFLQQHPSYAFIGSAINLINADGVAFGKWRLDFPGNGILPEMLFHNCFVNSSVVFRNAAVEGFQLPASLSIGEDYLLWWHLLKWGKGSNLPDFLLNYRRHPHSMMHLHTHDVQEYDRMLYDRLLEDVGLKPSEAEMSLHIALKGKSPVTSVKMLHAYHKWLKKIGHAIAHHPRFYPWYSMKVILRRWLKVCFKCRYNPFLLLMAVLNIPFYLMILKLFLIDANRFSTVDTQK